MVHFILVTESVYHKGKFDRKFWQRHTVWLILYIQEELNVSRLEAKLMVECYEKRDSPVYGQVLGLSGDKDRTSENNWTSTTITDIRMKVGTYHYGFCYSSTPQS